MDADAMEPRNSSQYTSGGSSDDSNYVSYQDNESVTMDSDDDYVAHQKNENQKACSKRRLQSFRNGGKVFRNASTSSMERIERQPTRRPNPKIFNRNALMARENRKKKKQHLETLERDVDKLKDENKTLRQKLQKRSTMVHKLRDEGLYLKSVIANKTSIMTLLRTIQGNKLPITSSNMSFMTDLVEQSSGNDRILNSPAATLHSCSSPSSSLLSSCEDEQQENGTVLFNEDPFLSSSLMANQLFSFTDLDQLGFSKNNSCIDDEMKLDNWQSLLNDDTPFQTKYPDDNVELSSTVSSEHNYFNNNFIEQTNADEPGICLHLSSGRISLEFCSSCHRNSQNAWIEEL